LFSGYLPVNHLGILATIRSSSPFSNIDALVFMGENDQIISNEQTLEQAALFSSPVVITSSSAGHNMPVPSDHAFVDVVNFRPHGHSTVLTPAPTPATTMASESRQKILCLHGGGANGASFKAAMSSLESAWSSNFEFIFADAPYAGGVWIPDPPGGKGHPTTDPNWASASIEYLDGLVRDHGPFYGILGYSQGSAFVPVYLSHAAAGTFQVAMLFSGYLPVNHLGILATIRSSSPFSNIDALVFMGENDQIISNEQTLEQAALFSSPVVIRSSSAAHNMPDPSDPTFEDVVQFRQHALR